MRWGMRGCLLAVVCAFDLALAGLVLWMVLGGGGLARPKTQAASVMESSDNRGVEQTPAADGQPADAPSDSPTPRKGFLALTFDDGPDARYTASLLDGLKARGIRATFFLMGQNIPGNEALVRRMKEEGHLIGIHGYRHVQLTTLSVNEALAQLLQTSDLIEEITGRRPEWLRPPYGDWSEELDEAAGLSVAGWTVDSLDWRLQDRGQIVARVLKDVEDGDMILLHDIFPDSVAAALELADYLSKEGYEFVTAEELLID